MLWGPLVFIAALIVIFVLVELFAITPGPSAVGDAWSDVQGAALTTLKELTQLFITWSLAIIAGTAYFLKAAVEGDHKLTRTGLLAAEGVIVCAVISIFLGHLTLNSLLNMLALGIFNARDRAVLTYGIGQYLAFLVALLAFFVFIHVTYSSLVATPHGKESK